MMPGFQATFTVDDGPMVKVRINRPWAALVRSRAAGAATPQPVEVSAIVDTGAEMTCIDHSIARQLGLDFDSFGFTNAPIFGGVVPSAEYEVGVDILHPTGNAGLNLRIPSLMVLGLSLGSVGYEAILGRDILARCVFTYDGPAGEFTLTF